MSEYEVNDLGRITSPGKFEGQNRYMPMIYNAYLDGFAHEMGHGNLCVYLSAGDYTSYPELVGKAFVVWYEDENGFVHEGEGAVNYNG